MSVCLSDVTLFGSVLRRGNAYWNTRFRPVFLIKNISFEQVFHVLGHIFCTFRFELKGSEVQKVVQNTKIGPHILQLPL